MDGGKIQDAACLIIDFELFEKFNPLDLFMQMFELNDTRLAKQILEKLPNLRIAAIEKLCNPKYVKKAADLVVQYKLDPYQFPELIRISESNSCNYFISRGFRAPTDGQYLPLYKVEEMFEGHTTMLEDYIRILLRKNMCVAAKGVYLRNLKDLTQNYELKAEMEDIEYEI